EAGRGGAQGAMWAPAIEVQQREGKFIVRAELPGLNPNDVNIEVTEDALVISGERKEEHDEEKGGVHLTERRYGHFLRSVPLPEGAQPEQARAKFDNGILEIDLPLQERRSERRQIPIQGASKGTSGS